MGHLPIIKPREVIALLEELGFSEVRQRGSLNQFRHPDGRCTKLKPFFGSVDVPTERLGGVP